jgi:predicted flap endonuclease-1-like 5' DNA nuclease
LSEKFRKLFKHFHRTYTEGENIMRSDYVLYVVAILCFIVTGAVAAYAVAQQTLWIVTTAVLGFVFVGIGYTQRPRASAPTQMAVAPPPPPPTPPTPKAAQPPVQTRMEEKKTEPQPTPVIEVKPPTVGLLDVKGIKEKRAQQLKAIGINTVQDLANASAEDLASKLKIAPYFTGQWINNAKEILKKS